MNDKDKLEKEQKDAKPDTTVRDMMILIPVLLIWIGAIVYSNFY
jgi:hypothetical protein